jgi:hydrogenase small subunit
VLPGLPEVVFHWPLIDYECGPAGGRDDFLRWFFAAADDELDAPFMLVVEGSIPNEKIKSEGYWAAFGNDPDTGEPIPTSDWVERLAPKAPASASRARCRASRTCSCRSWTRTNRPARTCRPARPVPTAR